MKFEFYDSESKEITQEFIDHLWKLDICMDDWDYMLFFESGFKTWEDEPCHSNMWTIELRPTNSHIECLLNGYCYNKWYPIDDFMGKKGILGVAYHA